MTLSILFPAKILNLRINTSIEQFIKDYEQYLTKKGWPVDRVEKVNEYHWKCTDFEIRVSDYHPDKAIKAIQYALFLPSVRELKDNKPVINYTHTFKIELPREYPARVDKIKIFAETQIFHPRFASSGWGEGCIHINGEVDRILMDMIFQVLFDPERIRPPKFYQDSDFGTNSTAMKWFQGDDPNKFYEYLTNLWFENRGKKINKTENKTIDKPSNSKGLKILD